ncbi:DUF4391 domain-containing protein [Caloramator proteoclasticus]|uniref:DUF4391 domain-containing protein n=1 Tax=Caloramator proteoclasticus DSM 10124 TaxID=1121262 RepID=A0A1M5BA89_9CLOT|nr:DUF4391 domain-containing protein [Caloramator proteoclasticus]SHF39350.1 protein of unknown function [Caloramator proteoclasticus DSM 10124]
MGDIFQLLGYRDRLVSVGTKIDKKALYENAEISAVEKKIIIDGIEKMQIEYLLNSKTINISSYQDEDKIYQAVVILRVYLKNINNVDKIAQILQKSFPNPTIIFFEYGNEICISTAHKRINKLDKEKAICGEINLTGFIPIDKINEVDKKFLESIKINNLPFSDFYDFYSFIDEAVYLYKKSNLLGKYEIEQDEEKRRIRKQLIEEYERLNNELAKITKQIKKETQFNKKAQLNMEAVKIKSKIDELKQKL